MYHLSCHRFLIANDCTVSIKCTKKFSFCFGIVFESISEISSGCALMDSKVPIVSAFDDFTNSIDVYSIVRS